MLIKNILIVHYSTWSSVNRESSWPDSSGDDASGKDWPNSSQPPSQAFSDLVPEFEPGKPWKVKSFNFLSVQLI